MIKKIIWIVLTLILVIVYIFIQKSSIFDVNNGNIPVITFDQQQIEVSVKDKDRILLDGVHAYDKEDGDISKKVSIESQSEFMGDNTRKITYVVFDEDDNIAKATRMVKYKDYTPPKFSLSDQLRSPNYSTKELIKVLSASSCVDGDITSKISVMNSSYGDDDVLNLKLSVTDSTNTTSFLNTHYYLSFYTEYRIVLNEYLVYLTPKEKYDFKSNIKSILNHSGKESYLVDDVKIDIPKMDKQGVYEVNYNLEMGNGDTGLTTMIVIVN